MERFGPKDSRRRTQRNLTATGPVFLGDRFPPFVMKSTCCEPKRSSRATCPERAREGKAVQRITLESLVREPERIGNQPYRFCASPECPVAYFSDGAASIFHKADLKVRVGIKEKEDPGRSTAVEAITKEVKAGRCFCERSNPQGACCLGNVSKTVKEGMKIYANP